MPNYVITKVFIVAQIAKTEQNPPLLVPRAMEKNGLVYKFGPFELRLRARELYKHGAKLRLRPQPFRVLQILLEHAGELVTREELHRELWSSDTFVDFEHGLNTAVKELRGILADSATEPRYIETLPRLGYRVIVTVEAMEPPARQATVAPMAEAITQKVMEQRSFPPWYVLVGISIALIAGATAYFHWAGAGSRAPSSSKRSMLAVLPFENLTGDPSQEYFSDGLTEEMITQLGRLDPVHLGVIAHTSVMHYKRDPEQLERVRRDLGVQYVVEGSVRRDANRLRISAQLIQVKDQSPMWSQQYDREISNVLNLQVEIAEEIAREIKFTLGDSKPNHSNAPLSAQSADAYDLYLKGRYFWNKRTLDGFQRAIEYFQQSINKDPNFARAYAGLADSYALMSGYAGAPPGDLISKAQAAAHRAVELDDNLAEAHTSAAVVAQNFDWDWATAEKEYRRAIDLDDNYAPAHHWYAEHLAFMGRFDEAFGEIERARQLDPLSLIIATDNGVILYYAKRYDAAIKQLRAVQDMDPLFPRAATIEAVFVQKGMHAEALADQKRSQAEGPWYWANLASIYGRLGRPAEANAALGELQRLDRNQHVDSLAFVMAYIGMNKKDRAVAYLQKAYREHSIALASLKVDPLYDPIRSDPRFQEVLRQVHLAP